MPISQKLLEVLACPICKTPVEQVTDWVVCTSCKRRYPTFQNVALMVPEEGELPAELTQRKSEDPLA